MWQVQPGPACVWSRAQRHSQAASRDKVVLYYGVRNAEHMAYADQLDAWREAGVQVVPVLSEEGHGYVQDVFKAVRVLGCAV